MVRVQLHAVTMNYASFVEVLIESIDAFFFSDHTDRFHVSTDVSIPWLCKYLTAVKLSIHMILYSSYICM